MRDQKKPLYTYSTTCHLRTADETPAGHGAGGGAADDSLISGDSQRTQAQGDYWKFLQISRDVFGALLTHLVYQLGGVADCARPDCG